MQDERKFICTFIENILNLKKNMPFKMDEVAEEEKPLYEALEKLDRQINDAYKCCVDMADGILDTQAKRNNLLAGPLRDLQSNLKHLKWQVSCVARGDYGQKVDFMGDFSIAFNEMIQQLSLKEKVEREKEEMESKVIEMQESSLIEIISWQERYYQEITEMYEAMRIYRHDMRNHMLCIKCLLENGKAGEAIQYVERIGSQSYSNEVLFFTGNHILDVLLSEKIEVAKRNGIEVKTQLSLAPNMKVTPMDWCMIIGNALDNAIEACMKVCRNKRKIIVIMLVKAGMLHIIIENTINKKPVLVEGEYRTDKRDTKNHGIGLKSIEKALARYEGKLRIEYDAHKFMVKMYLKQ